MLWEHKGLNFIWGWGNFSEVTGQGCCTRLGAENCRGLVCFLGVFVHPIRLLKEGDETSVI